MGMGMLRTTRSKKIHLLIWLTKNDGWKKIGRCLWFEHNPIPNSILRWFTFSGKFLWFGTNLPIWRTEPTFSLRRPKIDRFQFSRQLAYEKRNEDRLLPSSSSATSFSQLNSNSMSSKIVSLLDALTLTPCRSCFSKKLCTTEEGAFQTTTSIFKINLRTHSVKNLRILLSHFCPFCSEYSLVGYIFSLKNCKLSSNLSGRKII